MPCITKSEPMDSESSASDNKNNDKSNTESKRPEDHRSTSQPYPDIRLPLEMKIALSSTLDKPSLRATCDVSVGHVWGPYRTAGIFRNISPGGENSFSMAYREITILSRNSRDLIVRVNEENAWIKLLQETTFSDVCNVEINVDTAMETITVVALSNISSGSQIRGVVRLAHSNSTGSSKSGSPSPPVISVGFSGTPGPNTTSTIGGPKRDKKCLYCGIFFSSVDTLTAHMTNYCSRRPQITSPGNTIGGNASGTAANSVDKSSTSTIDSSDLGVGKNATSQNSTFPWPSRTTPGKRLNGSVISNAPQSPHSSNRMGHGGVTTGASPTGLHRALHPPPTEMAGVFNTGDAFLNFASTLASLARLRPHLPPTDIPHLTPVPSQTQMNHSKQLDEKSPRTPFCYGCQRYYSSSIYQFHVNISQKLKKLATEGNTDVTHLAEASKRLGLVVTAPIITDAGFIYVPVHPDCGGGTAPVPGQSGESGGRAPLDLRTGRSSASEEIEKENACQQNTNTASSAATNNLLASLFSGLVGGGLNSPAPQQPPPPANWWLGGGKMPDAATLEALLQAVTASSLQTHQINASSSGGDMGRNSAEGQPTNVEIQRPYLCNNCQTRFQALSTFKAHQQYYCQGRRKTGGTVTSENTTSYHDNAASSSTPQSTKSSTSSEQSRSPKRRRFEDVVAEACQISLKATNSKLPPTSPQSQGGESSETSPSGRSVNTEWEHVGNGSSELRCRLCGYIGQTPRGMKMHNRLHEGPAPTNSGNPRTKSAHQLSPNSPNSSSIVESNSSPPQSYPTQQLC